MAMERKWAMKWARDLETTSARQTKGELNNGKGGFCCLGRACVVGGLRAQKLHGAYRYGAEENGCYAPDEIVRKFGMSSSDPLIDGVSLSTRNDEGMSFRDIAKLIRKRWREM